MQRRDFIKGTVGLAAAWPLAVRAQQTPPVIGYLVQFPLVRIVAIVAAVRRGLAETGLVEGKDYISEFRSAGGDVNLLPV